MQNHILDHYLEFSAFTDPGLYKDYLSKLPGDVRQLGNLVSHQVIHSVTLKEGNTRANKNLIYGDMGKFPWHRLRCEDDIFPTSVSMIAELFRLDKGGFTEKRKVEDKIVVTCRYVAILMASILKSKGIPCRVRSTFAPYFTKESLDHWINQYWDGKRWVTFDADGFLDFLKFDQYDIPESKVDWPAQVWLGLRQGRLEPDHFQNADGSKGLMPVLWELFYDFHSIMNHEILYKQVPAYISFKFDSLVEKDFLEIDALATLMLDPDKNFDELKRLWETKKKFRILNSPSVTDEDHVNWRWDK